MKNIFFTGLIIFLTGCSSKQQKPLTMRSVKATSGEMILLGKINKANLQVSPLTPWFNQYYQRISIDAKWTENVKPYLKGLRVKIFMGTWCEDSQREVPGFLKIIDALEANDQVQPIIGLNEDKVSHNGSAEQAGVTNVPTFIFSKDGNEINRIVEFPIISLERDILDILQVKGYKHAYDF